MKTNEIIQGVKNDIQETINNEQKKLDNINDCYEQAEKFLLDNGFSEINEDDDILVEVMKCIKEMKNQIKVNTLDITNINQSINSLNNLNNKIDVTILKTLKDKIVNIEEYNESSLKKISDSKIFLDTLLSLETICPVCGGNQNKNCTYCNNNGIIDIATILQKDNLLETFEQKNNYQSQENIKKSNMQNNMNNMNNNMNKVSGNSNKFVISRTN